VNIVMILGFEVLTVVSTERTGLWDVTACRAVEVHQL
jgi:hypothetical protein